MRKDKPMRVDAIFEAELREVKLERIRRNIDRDKKMKSDRRLTEGIRRHRYWPEIKKDLTFSDLKEKNK